MIGLDVKYKFIAIILIAVCALPLFVYGVVEGLRLVNSNVVKITPVNVDVDGLSLSVNSTVPRVGIDYVMYSAVLNGSQPNIPVDFYSNVTGNYEMFGSVLTDSGGRAMVVAPVVAVDSFGVYASARFP